MVTIKDIEDLVDKYAKKIEEITNFSLGCIKVVDSTSSKYNKNNGNILSVIPNLRCYSSMYVYNTNKIDYLYEYYVTHELSHILQRGIIPSLPSSDYTNISDTVILEGFAEFISLEYFDEFYSLNTKKHLSKYKKNKESPLSWWFYTIGYNFFIHEFGGCKLNNFLYCASNILDNENIRIKKFNDFFMDRYVKPYI